MARFFLHKPQNEATKNKFIIVTSYLYCTPTTQRMLPCYNYLQLNISETLKTSDKNVKYFLKM